MERSLTQWMIWSVIVGVGLLGVLGWALYESDRRLVAEEQVRELQTTIDRLVPAVKEWTAMPCAKVDMVDLGIGGFIIGGVYMPNMTAEDVRRYVSKSETPGFPTTYVYITGSNSTPQVEIIALKPECSPQGVR